MSKLTTVISSNNKLKNKLSSSLKGLEKPISLSFKGNLSNDTSSIKVGAKTLVSGDKGFTIPVDSTLHLNSSSKGSIKNVGGLDTNIQDPNNPFIELTFYDDSLIQGGYRVVATVEDRDNIHCCYRKKGMKVMVVGQDLSFKEYVLLSEKCTGNSWKEVEYTQEIEVTEGSVVLTEDYSELGEMIKSQKDLNIILKSILKNLQEQIEELDIPTNTSDLVNDGQDGLNPFITAQYILEQVNSDWEATSGPAEILNKPIIGEADKNYVHDQAVPKSIWTIDHTLNKKVSITITDTAGTVVEGQVTINDGNKVVIEFNFPFSGEAILN